jgi:hypothetical protein
VGKFQWVILIAILSFLGLNAALLGYVIHQCSRVAIELKQSPAEACPNLGENYAKLGAETLAVLLALGAFTGTPPPPTKL